MKCFLLSERITTARLWAILHVVSCILIFVLQGALKINAYNPWDCWRLVDGPDEDLLHYTMGIWNILTKTLAIFTTGIAKDLTETRTVSHGDQLCSRWTWWRHGQYPKGVCYMADGPDGRRAVSQGGLLYGSIDRTEAGTVPQGVCYMVDGPDWESPRISSICIWSLDLTNLWRNGALYHLQFGVWTMFDGTTGCLTGSIEHKTNWFDTNITCIGKR